MNEVYKGLRDHQVVLIRGDSPRTLPQLTSRVPCTVFSILNLDLKVIAASLHSRSWDGTRRVVVFCRCESSMSEIAPLIRARHAKQSVVLLTDGQYSSATPLMQSLSSVNVVLGKLPTTLFSSLRSGPMTHVGARYQQAIDCTDLPTVIEQIHHTHHTLTAVPDPLSDIDVLLHHVPNDLIQCLLPKQATLEYLPRSNIHAKIQSNTSFARLLPTLVAKTTGSVTSVHETLQYLREAYRIEKSPQFVQCPRDDSDPRRVQNVNDAIRVLVSSRLSRTKSPTKGPGPSGLKRPREESKV